MFITRMLLVLCLGLVASSIPARAEIVDDTIQMSAAGAGDDVIIAWLQKQGGYSMNADRVLRLKAGKVSDRVVMAMLQSAAGPGVPAVATEAPADPAPAPVTEETEGRAVSEEYVPSSSVYTGDAPAAYSPFYANEYPFFPYYYYSPFVSNCGFFFPFCGFDFQFGFCRHFGFGFGGFGRFGGIGGYGGYGGFFAHYY